MYNENSHPKSAMIFLSSHTIIMMIAILAVFFFAGDRLLSIGGLVFAVGIVIQFASSVYSSRSIIAGTAQLPGIIMLILLGVVVSIIGVVMIANGDGSINPIGGYLEWVKGVISSTAG